DAPVEIQTHRRGRFPRRLVVMADDDVGQPVAIDVAYADAGGGVVFAEALPLEDLTAAGTFDELALAVVEIEAMVAVPFGEEDIRPAVVVDVGDGDAEAGELRGKAGVGGDV